MNIKYDPVKFKRLEKMRVKQTLIPCSACGGTGLTPKKRPCRYCDGRGYIPAK